MAKKKKGRVLSMTIQGYGDFDFKAMSAELQERALRHQATTNLLLGAKTKEGKPFQFRETYVSVSSDDFVRIVREAVAKSKLLPD